MTKRPLDDFRKINHYTLNHTNLSSIFQGMYQQILFNKIIYFTFTDGK